MKIRLLPFALIMILLISACSDKDHDGGIKGDTKTVFLQLKMASEGDTRSVEPTATGTSAPLLTAIIYFLSGNDIVYDVRTVGQAGADVTLDQFQNGYQFEDIPSTVSQVYVVGNYNSSDMAGDFATFPVNTGTTLAQIRAVVLNIEQVAHGSLGDGSTYSGLLTVMDGQSMVREYVEGGNDNTWQGAADLSDGDFYAEVEVVPVNSRIEIEEISYEGSLLSFTLEGIYINYYFPEAPLSLVLSDGDAYINNGSNVDAYNQDSDDFAYTYYMTLYNTVGLDGTPATGGGETSFVPNGDGEVWAYHVFGNSNPVPHIILRLTNVVAADGTNLGTRFVTVTGFMNGTTEITTFQRNTIYKITNLAFDDGDIDVLPETETINLWVHVTVRPWTTIEVTPII